MHFKKLFLYASVSSFATFGLTSVAHAQDESSAVNDSSELEEVVVTGIRGSLQRNLEQKRNANAVVEALTAEDIGKFPDKNLAESLQRIPGVAINRGFAGEGNEVSIRGVNPELNVVTLNGQSVASTSWFSLAFNRRSFNMDLMPAELVSGLEIYKSPMASLDEGGVGGVVNIKTRKPLDLDPLTVYASFEAMTNSVDDEGDVGFGANGLISWKNDNETFGILGALSSVESIGRGQKAENYWEEAWTASGIAQFEQNKEREVIDLTAQFSPSDTLGVVFHYFNTELDASNTNQNFLVINGCCVPGDYPGTYTPAAGSRVAANGLPLTGSVVGAAWLAQDTNTRRPVMETEVVDVKLDYVGDGFNMSATVGSTEGSGGNGGNANGLWGMPGTEWAVNGVTVDYDMDLANEMLMTANGVSLSDPSWQMNNGASIAETFLNDEETYGQLDFEFDVDWGAIQNVKTGIKIRNHEFGKSQSNAVIDTSFLAGESLESSGFADGGFSVSNEVLASGSSSTIARINGEAYYDALLANTSAWTPVPGAYGVVEEDITAYYVQGDFEGGGFRGNLGVRYVETDVSSSSYDADGVTLVSRSADYSDWLPSLNLAVDLSDDVILRMSAARVMSRPSYSNLNPALGGINPTAMTASRGDVGMDPFRATQMDMAVEWYFEEEALLSVGMFTKDIRSFVTSTVIQEFVDDGTNPGIWNVTVPVQGSGGKVQGIEIQYQKPFGNFGMLANLTLSNGEGDDGSGNIIDLPGNSETSYNVTGYYENEILSTRLAYTYRDEFLAEGTAISGSLDTFDEQAYLDYSLTWHAMDFLDLSFEAVNLLGEVTYQRHSTGSQTVRVITDNGTRYFIRASLRF